MAVVKMAWLPSSRDQFEKSAQQARDAGRLSQFQQVHNDIARALADLDAALANGEVLISTRKPGGEIHHWLYQFISVWYVLFRQERAGWILRYQLFPEMWPLP
jgi:hypothetical protein